jgi:Asp-tRNA(Asn)/Glu-tRNA(Gln) amidotransferase A subunit family amidase
VRLAGRAFAELGAKVEEVTIPWHRDAMPVWNAVALEGATAIMAASESVAHGGKGRYSTGLVDIFGAGRRANGERLSETVKLTVLAGRWMSAIPNTAPFDVTGHPGMNVPCAMSEGLPVSMMLVGRHGDERTILGAAAAYEVEAGARLLRDRGGRPAGRRAHRKTGGILPVE